MLSSSKVSRRLRQHDVHFELGLSLMAFNACVLVALLLLLRVARVGFPPIAADWENVPVHTLALWHFASRNRSLLLGHAYVTPGS